jgi:phenylalanyl-tRNA synthetase beta chain
VSFDVWDLKSIAEEIAAELSLTLEQGADDPLVDNALSFRLRREEHAGSSGFAGRIRAERVDAPAWADDVWGLEVRVAVVTRDVVERAGATAEVQTERPSLRYRELPQFPAIERDLALLVPDGVPAQSVADAIRGEGGVLLEVAEVFDLYSGKSVAEGTRSIAFRLRFRAADRTLTDAEVEPVVKRILQRLESDHGIRQRA